MPIDDLERYVASADVESTLAWPLRGAHPSYMLVLLGGVSVLAKPADEAPAGPAMSRREVAAWVLARELGWHDLIAVTVLRTIPSQKEAGKSTEASLQVIWPANEKGPALAPLRPDDVVRAALLDALMVHGDRHGGNYLAVPPTGSGVQPRLKLVDHGYAFTANDTGSPFYQAVRGQEIPNNLRADLDRLAGRARPALGPLLVAAELDPLVGRIETLRTKGRFDLS